MMVTSRVVGRCRVCAGTGRDRGAEGYGCKGGCCGGGGGPIGTFGAGEEPLASHELVMWEIGTTITY